MHIVRAEPTQAVGGSDSAPAYRVRLWFPPPAVNFVWLVDEWDVTNVEQVTDVIQRAAGKAAGNPFEVFLRWEDHRTSKDGQLEPYSRYVLIYGRPAVEESTTETVFFETK